MLDQRKYITELLQEFGLADTFTVTTPVAGTPSTDDRELNNDEAATFRRMLGCLVWLAIMTRPDIAYAVSAASVCMHAPRVLHRVAVIRIYRYLAGTVNLRLCYNKKM